MLFLCNGSPKSGVTWLAHIFRHQPGWIDPLPAPYNEGGKASPRLSDETLALLGTFDFYQSKDYYARVHASGFAWFHSLLDLREVRMLSIVRDVRDQLVSRYHHDQRVGRLPPDTTFAQFMERRAPRLVETILDYNRFWYAYPGRGPVTTAYEFLKADFNNALVHLTVDLKLPARRPFDIGRARRRTDFSRMNDTGAGKFMRKGIVGDHRNHMAAAEIEAVEAQLRAGGYPELKRRMVALFPHLEPHLAATDVGLG